METKQQDYRSSAIEFNGKMIYVIPLSETDKSFSGELIKLSQQSFILKTKDGLLVSNHIGRRQHYSEGYFEDQPTVLNALKRFKIVTAKEIKQYKEAYNKRKASRLKYNESKNILASSKRIGLKLTKKQIEIINSMIS